MKKEIILLLSILCIGCAQEGVDSEVLIHGAQLHTAQLQGDEAIAGFSIESEKDTVSFHLTLQASGQQGASDFALVNIRSPSAKVYAQRIQITSGENAQVVFENIENEQGDFLFALQHEKESIEIQSIQFSTP